MSLNGKKKINSQIVENISEDVEKTDELRIIVPGEPILKADDLHEHSSAEEIDGLEKKYEELKGVLDNATIKEKKKLRWGLELKDKSTTKNETVETETSPLDQTMDDMGLKFEQTDEFKVIKSKDVLSKYYFQVQNHYELFKIGSTFLQDFRAGSNKFSFAHINRLENLQESILALATFFNYHVDQKVIIVTPNFEGSIYQKVLRNELEKVLEKVEDGHDIEINRIEGLDIIDFRKLGKIVEAKSYADAGKIISSFLKKRDVCLFELPSINAIEKERERYFPIIQMLKNITFVMGDKTGNSPEIRKMIDYYSKYDVLVKGVIWTEPEIREFPFLTKLKKIIVNLIFEQTQII